MGSRVIAARARVTVRVRGTVQGVGFRPNVYRLALACDITGDVRNDAEGVLIHAAGEREAIERFIVRIRDEAPPLARITALDVSTAAEPVASDGFRIVASVFGRTRTRVAADAALCAACRAEVLDPFQRRYRYPFANCTTAARGSRSSSACRTTGRARRWRPLHSAPSVRRNTAIRPTAASTRSRSRVIAAGRARASNAWTAAP